MSLGVRHLWRSWRHASLAPRVSFLIPRELPFRDRPSLTSPVPAVSFSTTRWLEARGTASSNDTLDSCGGTTQRSPDSPMLPSDINANTFNETLRIKSQMFMERLAKTPVRSREIRGPVVVQQVNEYPHPRERARALRKVRKSIAQYKYYARRQLIYKTRAQNWRRVLKTLADDTPDYPPVVGVAQVIIPESSIPRLMEDPATDIWAIGSRTGCGVWVHKKKPDDPQDNTYLLLSGDKPSVNQALRALLELSRELTIIHLTMRGALKLEKDVSPVLWRRDFAVKARYFLTKKLDEIEKPEHWTPSTFERYITALIKSRLPSGLAYELGEGSPHIPKVARAVYAAFLDPAARSVLSITSFKIALRYFVQFGPAFWPHARSLFDLMRSLGFKMDTEVYDILSLTALKVNNLGFFHYIVTQMRRDGLTPSFKTWIHFLRLIKAENIRRYILHVMYSKGLFSYPSAMHHLATELVQHDIQRALQLGLDVDSFVAGQNKLYGPQWLRRRAANQVLDELGSHGKFDNIDKFLTIMFQNDKARPQNEIALNIILTHCRNQRNIDAAIHFVKRFESEMGCLKADSITYHLLSDLAWRLKKPHVFSLLVRWSYITQLTPRRLTMRVHELLTPLGGRPRLLRRFLSRLKIASIASERDSPPEKGQSSRVLMLSMQNLLMHDYKKTHGTPSEQLLTAEEIKAAFSGWYRQAFRDQIPYGRLGKRLSSALEKDRRCTEKSHAGEKVVLEPGRINTRKRPHGRDRHDDLWGDQLASKSTLSSYLSSGPSATELDYDDLLEQEYLGRIPAPLDGQNRTTGYRFPFADMDSAPSGEAEQKPAPGEKGQKEAPVEENKQENTGSPSPSTDMGFIETGAGKRGQEQHIFVGQGEHHNGPPAPEKKSQIIIRRLKADAGTRLRIPERLLKSRDGESGVKDKSEARRPGSRSIKHNMAETPIERGKSA